MWTGGRVIQLLQSSRISCTWADLHRQTSVHNIYFYNYLYDYLDNEIQNTSHYNCKKEKSVLSKTVLSHLTEKSSDEWAGPCFSHNTIRSWLIVSWYKFNFQAECVYRMAKWPQRIPTLCLVHQAAQNSSSLIIIQ